MSSCLERCHRPTRSANLTMPLSALQPHNSVLEDAVQSEAGRQVIQADRGGLDHAGVDDNSRACIKQHVVSRSRHALRRPISRIVPRRLNQNSRFWQ